MHNQKASAAAAQLTFRCFNRKSWSLFGCLGREVRIGVLAVATLAPATATTAQAAAVTPRTLAETIDDADNDEANHLAADSLLLSEATVTAQRAPIATAAARQVVTLSHENLAAAGVKCVADVLKLSSGVDVRQRGGFGLQTDISIDGGTFDQIALMVNGIPVVNPQTGHNAADFPLNLSDILRIEIVEGAASRVAGSQAFGGAINIITRGAQFSSSSSPHSKELSATLEAGSYGTVRAEARAGAVFGAPQADGRFFSSLSASFQRSDGAVKNGDFKGGKLFWQGRYAHPTVDAHIQAGFTSNDFGANTFYSAAYPNQWEATRRLLVSARAETKGRIHFAPTLSWLRSTDHFQLIRHTSTGENFHRGDVFSAGLNAWTDWALGRTAFGGELREEGIYSTNLGRPLSEAMQPAIPGHNGLHYTKRDDRTNVTYHLEHNVALGAVSLSAGMLAERNSAIDDRFRFYPGLDVSYRPSLSWRLYASANRALRLPSFTDLYYKSPTQEGNAGLRPEECTSFRLGADFTARGLSLRLKGHFTRGEHMIDWVMRQPDDIYHATAFSLNKLGAGFDLTLRPEAWWGSAAPVSSLALSYAYLYQHRRAGEPYFKSNYALEYVRHKFTAQLNHRIHLPALTASWTFRLQEREGSYLVYENLRPTGELRPYGVNALLDVRVNYALAHSIELYVDAQNVTSHRYFDLAGVRQAGLVVMGGVRLSMNN